jgi:GTP-binding protein
MKSEYLMSFADASQLEDLFQGSSLKGYSEPRIAVVGRSNVGKSTLINTLLGAKLAYTSSQPGKTRAIHFYHWRDGAKIIADLPGYGYARAARSERERWETFIRLYFESDGNLQAVILLLDARHGPTPADLDAMRFLREKEVFIIVVFAKADALKNQSERARRKKEATQALTQVGALNDSVFWVSSHTGLGMKELVGSLKKIHLSIMKGSEDV